MKIILVSFAALLISTSCFAARSISSVELQHADPQVLMQALQAHIEPPSSISLYQNRVVINATDNETKQLHAIIEQLDGSTQQIFIAVKQGNTQQQNQQQFAVKPSIRYSKGSLPTTTEVTVKAQRQSFGSSASSSQGVRTTEGRRTWIASGEKIAINSTSPSGGTRQDWAQANRGFYATAFIHGNSVNIELEQSNQQLTAGATISGQQLQTAIEGPLNTWILAGYIQQQSRGKSDQGLINIDRSGNSQSQSIPVYIKVSIE